MSRIAPSIPVDLNSRRVLVDDLFSRVPRCECCPTLDCSTCEQSELGLVEIQEFQAFTELDFRFLITEWERGETREAHKCVPTRGFDPNLSSPFDPDLQLAFFPNIPRWNYPDIPFPTDQPVWPTVPNLLSVDDRPLRPSIFRGFPGGGLVTTVWFWTRREELRPVDPRIRRPRLSPPVVIANLAIGLIVDPEEPETIRGYVYSVWLNSPAIFGPIPPTWFENGILPPTTDPCRPDIFPTDTFTATSELRIDFRRDNRLVGRIGDFIDA